MDKQTKQLAALGALVVVAGIVAYFMYFKGPSTTAPADNTAAATPPATGAPAPGPAPAPGAGTAAPAGAAPGAATPGAPAGPVVLTAADALPMPKPEQLPSITYTWKADDHYGEYGVHVFKAGDMRFDPLHVQNIDVVDPDRRQYIEKIKKDWIIEGVTETWQQVAVTEENGQPKKDAEGKPVLEKRLVKEAWFQGIRKPYKEGDRLPATRFVIKKIVRTTLETSVQLIGDNGEELKLELSPPTRYPDAPG